MTATTRKANMGAQSPDAGWSPCSTGTPWPPNPPEFAEALYGLLRQVKLGKADFRTTAHFEEHFDCSNWDVQRAIMQTLRPDTNWLSDPLTCCPTSRSMPVPMPRMVAALPRSMTLMHTSGWA